MMSRMSSWSSLWQSRIHRPRVQRGTASRLEALEQRLNLAAVLVVETVDAFWLIEEPDYDSLAPAASADELSGDDLAGSAGFEEIGLELPQSVSPTTANGGALNAPEAQLAESLLSELWYSEPDFFYEDVLAVTFYDHTSMDALIDSGMFDDAVETDPFSNADLFASDFAGDSDVTNSGGGTVKVDQQVLGFVPQASNELGQLTHAVALNAGDSEISDIVAAAKAEVASWSKRLETDPFLQLNTVPAVAVDILLAASAPTRNLTASPSVTDVLPPNSHEDSLRDSGWQNAAAAANARQEEVAVREMTKLESFFAKFPSLGFGSSRSSMLRFVSDTSDAQTADDAAESNNSVPGDASRSLSYSQWASLLGVASLFGASQWRAGGNDQRETPAAPFRAKDNSKRPVAC